MGLLQREPMSDQRLQVDQALRHQQDGFWVRLVVAELEANVDLSERRVHERDRLEALPDTDDEHRATETRCLYNSVSLRSDLNDTISLHFTHIDGTVDAALHASALQRQSSLLSQGSLNPLRHLFRLDATLDLDSPYPGHQPSRHLQPTLIQISNHNRRSAGRMRRL
jgi:hypothetical protein